VGGSIDEFARDKMGLPPRPATEKRRTEGAESAGKVKDRMAQDKAAPYKVLGVDVEAEEEVVRAAYKAKARLYHPDKPGGSNEKMTKIDVAYEKICAERGWKK
jgi:DnaJ-class molecular chaperone